MEALFMPTQSRGHGTRLCWRCQIKKCCSKISKSVGGAGDGSCHAGAIATADCAARTTLVLTLIQVTESPLEPVVFVVGRT